MRPGAKSLFQHDRSALICIESIFAVLAERKENFLSRVVVLKWGFIYYAWCRIVISEACLMLSLAGWIHCTYACGKRKDQFMTLQCASLKLLLAQFYYSFSASFFSTLSPKDARVIFPMHRKIQLLYNVYIKMKLWFAEILIYNTSNNYNNEIYNDYIIHFSYNCKITKWNCRFLVKNSRQLL